MAKIEANVGSDFGVQGQDAAVKIIKAIREGEGVMRAVILSAALELHMDAQKTADWLAGLSKGLMDAGMAKGVVAARKSEAAKVFAAVHIDEDKVKGWTVGYHDFILACRELVNETLGTQGPGSRKGGPKAISDADKVKLVKRMTEADTPASVALELSNAATMAFIKSAGTPANIVRILNRDNQELLKSSDEFFKQAATRIQGIIDACLDRVAIEDAKHAEAKAKEQSTQADRMADVQHASTSNKQQADSPVQKAA